MALTPAHWGVPAAEQGRPPVPRPPRGLKTGGRKLWREVQERYELEEHESALLREMCRTLDTMEALYVIVEDRGEVDPETGRLNPALAEWRQQKIAFARLSGALRLPAGDESDHQAGARRPQRRAGIRGVYRPRSA